MQVCQKLCAPEESQPIQTTSFSYLMINIFNQDQKKTARTTDIIVLTLRMSLLLCTPKTGWRPSLMNHQLKGMWPPSSPEYKPLDYFMWCEFEREVNKQPRKHPGLSQGQDLRGNDQHWEGDCHPHLPEVLVSDWGYCGGQGRFNQSDVYVIRKNGSWNFH